jgi:hypothetical protein
VKSTIFHWVLVLFLFSGGLSAEVAMAPGHVEFAAEADFSSFDRQDESFRPSASRKRSSRPRKAKLPPATFLAPIAQPPYTLFVGRHPLLFSPATPSHQNLQQLHQVFRI